MQACSQEYDLEITQTALGSSKPCMYSVFTIITTRYTASYDSFRIANTRTRWARLMRRALNAERTRDRARHVNTEYNPRVCRH